MNKTNLLTKLLLLCLCVVGSVNVWGDNYTETYSNPTGSNPAARAAGMGAFTTIGDVDGNVSFGNSSLQIGTNGGSGTFTVSTTDGSYITEITFTQNSSYPANTLTSSDGTITGPTSNVWTFTPSSSTKTSCSFSMSAPSGKKTRIAPISVSITSNYEYLSKNFTISDGTVSCTKSNASSDLSITTTGAISNNGLSVAKDKTLTITSAGHYIKSIHFTYESHASVTYSASTGTCSSNAWTAGDNTKTVTFTSPGSGTIVGISVELEDIASGDAITLDKTLGTASGSGTIAANATSFTPTAPTYADHTVDGYYATYSAGAYSNYIATAAGTLQPNVTVSETAWTNESSQWVKGGDATFYTKWKVNAPTVSCENNTVTITIPTGSTVYYTTDGETEPTSSSTLYSAPFAIAATTTVKAIAIQSGCTSSTVTSQECEYVVPQVATPTISPADGSTFSGASQTITLSCGTDGATIYYTVDGSTPTSTSNEYDPEDKPSISSTTTIKAIAIKADWTDSEVATATIKKVTSSTWGSWDFTNWSSTTKTGTADDTDTWYDHEKSGGTGVDFSDGKGAVNKTAISTAAVIKYGSTNIAETDGLKFKADAYQFALVYNVSSALNDYHGNQYIWLFKSSSTITIPSVPANATIEIATETHKNTAERYVTLKNGSTTLTQTQGATSGDDAMAYQVCKWTNTSTEGDVIITPSAGLHIYYITVTANVETIPATIASSGWTSLASNKALNYADAEEQESVALKAYAISNITKTSVTLTPHDAAPANEGMILKGNPGSTYNIPVAASADEFDNELSAAVTATTVDANSVYAVSEGKLKLFTGTTVPAGKAYLLASKVDPEARGLSLNFDEDGETTGIAEINSKKGLLDGDFYDLSGRKVAQPTKGLYIMNGRKVIVK